jgi:pyruvate carboxylase
VLRGRQPIRGRPGASLPPADFAKARAECEQKVGRKVDDRELLAYLLYPRVFPDLAAHQAKYSDTSVLPTPTFFFGMQPGEEVSIEIERGKTLILKFLTVGDPHADGTRTVFFELNGQPREVVVMDHALTGTTAVRKKAESVNPLHVGAPMPGLVVRVAVSAGEQVAAGQKLFSIEAMKMETTLYAEKAGKVAEVLVQAGTQVEAGDLLLRFEG